MMRPLSTTAAFAIAAVLALMLMAYVFVGGAPRGADAAPHCTSQEALAQVKDELFRRAAAIRRVKDPGFEEAANYSIVRAGSRLVRRHHGGSDKVTCSGSIVLELPPGTAVVGGRHSLSASVAYDLTRAPGGTARLGMLSKADYIIVPLATVSGPARLAGQTAGAVPEANGAQSELAPPPPPLGPPAAQKTRPAPAQPPGRPPTVARAQPPKKAPPAKQSPPPKPASAAPAHARPNGPAGVPSATLGPSFNCRYARTRGEIAVCSDPALASLDRQMSTQFYRALASAKPGQRAMLERSRSRFLKYRDSCASASCIADAYRGRIAEIRDIMSGGW